jgi:hypothetical protein
MPIRSAGCARATPWWKMPFAHLWWVAKNWLFAGSPDGAKASATIFTLIETAKANGIDPYAYLRYIFENLPLAKSDQDLKDPLPQHIDPAAIAINDSN